MILSFWHWPAWVLAAGELVVGLGFCFGILLMNLPQHYLCWKHRSAEGLSLAYILICTISNATLALATLMGDYDSVILALATNTSDIGNATTASSIDLGPGISTTDMARSLLPVEGILGDDSSCQGLLQILATLNACMPTLQNFLSLLVGVPSLLLYYFWFSSPQQQSPVAGLMIVAELTGDIPCPERCAQRRRRRRPSHDPLLPPLQSSSGASVETETADSSSLTSSSTDDDSSSRRFASNMRYYYSDGTEGRWAVAFTIMSWCLVAVAVLVSASTLWFMDNNVQMKTTLLEVWGSTAAVTNVILFIPQIVTTRRNHHEGVLSLVSLLISVVGDVALAAFWILSAGESVWVYGACAVDAGMQLILIAMIIDFRKKRLQVAHANWSTYSYVYDAEENCSETEEEYQSGCYMGETEVVYGEILDIYSTASTAVEWLWDTPIMVTASGLRGEFSADVFARTLPSMTPSRLSQTGR